jgi:hypothetical protein
MNNELIGGLDLGIETVDDNKTGQAAAPVLKASKLFPRSAAAERMRLYRQRRRDGVRCITIELRDFEIYDLISLGLLRYETRNNIGAIEHALHKLLDQALA